MPTRILRDWTDSEPVNALSVHGERFFVRLLMKADDYGRQSGNPKLLRPLLYPLLLDEIRDSDLQRLIAECVKSGLVRLYEVDQKKYLEIRKFGQRNRAKVSKFPNPPSDDGHMTGICPTDDGHLRAYSESETECPPHPPPGGLAQPRQNSAPRRGRCGDSPGFERFWAEYPAGPRKVGESKCREKWRKIKLDSVADAVLSGLESWKASQHWQDGFVCGPHRFLNERFWENDPNAGGDSGDNNGFRPVYPTADEVVTTLRGQNGGAP